MEQWLCNSQWWMVSSSYHRVVTTLHYKDQACRINSNLKSNKTEDTLNNRPNRITTLIREVIAAICRKVRTQTLHSPIKIDKFLLISAIHKIRECKNKILVFKMRSEMVHNWIIELVVERVSVKEATKMIMNLSSKNLKTITNKTNTHKCLLTKTQMRESNRTTKHSMRRIAWNNHHRPKCMMEVKWMKMNCSHV